MKSNTNVGVTFNAKISAPRKRLLRRLRIATAWSADVASGVLVALDFVAILAAGLLSDLINAPGPALFQNHVAGSVIAAIGVIQVGAQFKLYDLVLASRPLPMVDRVVGAVATAFASLALIAHLADLPGKYPSAWKLGLFVLSITLIIGFRLLFTHFIVRLGKRRMLSRNVVVLGAGPHGERLIEHLERTGGPWTRVLCVFDDRARDPSGRIPKRLKQRYPVRGTTRDLVSYSRKVRVDDVFIALPWTEARITGILKTLEVIPANVHLWPDVLRHSQLLSKLSALDGMPVITMASKPIAGWGYVAKWLLDKTVALLAVVILSPLLTLVALLIRAESSGPILFKQARLGFNNKRIEVYKFRSMYHHARDPGGEQLTTRGDARITRVGAVIRRLSIDELPQLFNVLRGDMSLVGPRPHPLMAKAGGHLYHDVVGEYALRHKLKPGITGWAQVSGWRGETDTAEKIIRRVEHDLYYMNNWSIFFDLYIIVMTALKLPFHRNAF